MGQFLGDIAVMLEVLVFGVGLAIWHWASKEKSKTLFFAGGAMAIIAILGMLCSTYYYISYWREGAFRHPESMQHQMMERGMKGHMMGDGAMMGRSGTMPRHRDMMEKIETCIGQIQGQTMDEVKMTQMRECMMRQIAPPRR